MRHLLLFLLLSGPLAAMPQAQLLSDHPRILLIKDFLTHEECDQLMAQALPQLKPSVVVDEDTGEMPQSEARSSMGYFFPKDETTPSLVRSIEKRIADTIHFPIDNGEGLHVLRYQTGGEYKEHHDYFDPATQGGRAHMTNGGQRLATMILYLNKPKKGGATLFPDLGITVQPKKGYALLFYNCSPKKEIEPKTLHAGLPVLEGEKWIATKWIREKAYR